MKKNQLKLATAALAMTCILAVPSTQSQAAIHITKTDDGYHIVRETSSAKKKLRMAFLKHLGATDKAISQLDALKFFDLDIGDVGSVDVSTKDRVDVILQNCNINVNLYFNFITINK